MSCAEGIRIMSSGTYGPGCPEDGKCKICKSMEDLRPYGPNNSWICYRCNLMIEILAGVQLLIRASK